MPKFQEQNMYKTISNALENYKIVAKMELRDVWRELNLAQRCAAARALVFMEDVAKNPAHYFSRAQTYLDWHNRAVEFVRQKKLPDTMAHEAHEKVSAPADLVWKKCSPAMKYNLMLSDAYYMLCISVMDWEYNRTSDKKECRSRVHRDAQDIQYQEEKISRIIHVMNNTLTSNLRQWLKQH